jgi:hypothetical protein
VLDATAASYESLQATHQAALEELSALKRWIYGRRTEKIVEGEGQYHLFDLEPSSATATLLEPQPELSRPAATGRRRRRELDLDQLPHFRHEHDLSAADKQRQKELVLKSPVLTGGKEGSRQGRFWTYIGEQHPYSVYDFTESRARDGPAQFLAGFQGYLHADAYGGYDHIYLGSNDAIREVACWARAPTRSVGLRRKFFDARDSSPRDAHQILEWIRQLYDIEDQARLVSVGARRELRTSQAEPVLALINTRLAELERRALPKSALAKAVWHARNQWQALCRYTEDGRLSIDNNVSERTLRHQAIGRKNWLFLGSQQAGPHAAILFTILAGAKRHRIEPWAYLRELLLRLHGDNPRLDEMLPDQWAIQHPEAVLNYRLEESRRKAATRSSRRRHTRTSSRPR